MYSPRCTYSSGTRFCFNRNEAVGLDYLRALFVVSRPQLLQASLRRAATRYEQEGDDRRREKKSHVACKDVAKTTRTQG